MKDRVIELEQENEKLRMRNDMLRKDIDSFIEDNKVDYKARIDKAIEHIEKDLQISILPNNQIINGTEVVKRINKIEDILKGDSDE